MADNIKLLLAEDEAALGQIIKESLETRDFDVILCDNGEKAFEKYKSEVPEILVLDVMMPKKDGFTLAKEIRAIDDAIPIIFLTAKSMKEDTLKGFEVGGDDYITKPFNMEELVARVNAILKRSKIVSESHYDDIEIGEFTFNPKKQILSKDDFSVNLTTKESDLLTLLFKNKNDKVV